MPFPGSQLQNNVELAYNLNRYAWIWETGLGLLILYALVKIFTAKGVWLKVLASTLILLLTGVIYLNNFVMRADKIFYQPGQVVFGSAKESSITNDRIVIGIEQNGEAKAYPLNIIGYHHQVRDSLDNQPIMVTYCTVCRTGRVFRPLVDGKVENFRLVGMDQFNAMFEDATTHSWWRQATGECCAGPLKGKKLPEIPTQQMTLESWAHLYPQTKVLQPDPQFAGHYASLKGYDNGTIKSTLTGTDSVSGLPKSWVIVVVTKHGEKMYDWNELKNQWVISDSVEGEPILLTRENNENSFHVFSRRVNDSILNFSFHPNKDCLIDNTTSSVWDLFGNCMEGPMKGTRLKYIKAYQEFRHSYLTFPNAKTNEPVQ